MISSINENNFLATKAMFITLGGMLASTFAFFQPMYIYMLICIFAKIIDLMFAVRLSVRVKKTKKKGDGLFSSKKMNKMFLSLFCFGSLLMLFFLIDRFVLMSDGLLSTRFLCGAFVFQQIWSCLENESSSNDSKWAKVVQRIMVDKTERHLDIELPEYKEKDNDK